MKIMKETMQPDVSDIICDVCKKSTKTLKDMGFDGVFEYAELRGAWGYASNMDGETHECHLCETCYGKVKTFIESIGGDVDVRNTQF